jgi:hypothetical protein
MTRSTLLILLGTLCASLQAAHLLADETVDIAAPSGPVGRLAAASEQGRVLIGWNESGGRRIVVGELIGEQLHVRFQRAVPEPSDVLTIGSGAGVDLVVWRQGIEMLAVRLGADGAVLDPEPLWLGYAHQRPGYSPRWKPRMRPPAIAWNGDEFVVVWAGPEIKGARVSPGGSVTAFGQITIQAGISGFYPDAPALAWNGEDLLLVFLGEIHGGYVCITVPGCPPPLRKLYAMRLSRNGEPRSFTPTEIGGRIPPPADDIVEDPLVASDGGEFVVLSRSAAGAHLLRVETSVEGLSVAATRDLGFWGRASGRISLASTPSGYVAAVIFPGDETARIEVHELDHDGHSVVAWSRRAEVAVTDSKIISQDGRPVVVVAGEDATTHTIRGFGIAGAAPPSSWPRSPRLSPCVDHRGYEGWCWEPIAGATAYVVVSASAIDSVFLAAPERRVITEPEMIFPWSRYDFFVQAIVDDQGSPPVEAKESAPRRRAVRR